MGYFILGFIINTIVFYPYWIFGDFSAVGWYDEYDLPIYLLLLDSNNSFSNNIAGGALTSHAFPPSSSFNLPSLVLNIFDPVYGLAFMRIMYPTLGVMALLYFIERFKREETDTDVLASSFGWISFFIIYAAIYSSPYVYGWTFGGYGSSIILASIAAILICTRFTLRNVAFIFLTAFIQSASYGGLIVFAPVVFIFTVLFFVLYRRHNFKEVLRNGIIFFLVLFLFSYRELFSLLDIALNSSSLSRAGREVSHPSVNGLIDWLSIYLGGIANGNANPFSLNSKRLFGNGLWFATTTFILIFIFSFSQSKFRRGLLGILILLISPLVINTIGDILNYKIIQAMRWDQILIYVTLSFAVIIIFSLSRQMNKFKLGLLILYTIFISASSASSVIQYQKRSLYEIAGGNHWAKFNSSEIHAPLSHYRGFILSGYSPKPQLLGFYGYDMIDGMRASFTKDENTYFYGTILKDSRKSNPSRHTSDRATKIDLEALERVNVKYIISNDGSPNFTKIDVPHITCDTQTFLCWVLNFFNIPLKDPAYFFIKENQYPLGRTSVFNPEICTINSSLFYQKSTRELALCAEKVTGKYIDNAYIINDIDLLNFTVINHAITPFISIFCDDNLIEPQPASGQVIFLKKEQNFCSELKIDFSAKTLENKFLVSLGLK